MRKARSALATHWRMNVTIQQKALRLSVLGVLMVSIAFALSACNTVEGAGKDIESAGESISDAAD